MKVEKVLQFKLGKERAKMYLDSAPLFLARIETIAKNGFFIESIQFENEKGEKPFNRQYHLKFIGESVFKVLEFESEHKAMKFWESMEFTTNNDLVLARFTCPRYWFDARVFDHYRIDEKLYDNGCTAFYTFEAFDRAISYCEGDIVEYFCPKGCDNIKSDFLTFYNENEA